MNIRQIVFFIIDKIKSSRIKNELGNIQKCWDMTEDEYLGYIEKELKNYLAFVKRDIPYYQKDEFQSFDDLPVVNKLDIKNNYNLFISQKYKIDALNYVTTSGSTGTPFKAYRDEHKIMRHNADNIFMNRLAGYELGNKLLYFRIWNKLVNKSRLKQWMQNVIPLDAGNFNKKYLTEIFSNRNSYFSSSGMLAYASTFEGISDSIKHNDISISYKPGFIISMSETLPSHVRKHLKNVFECEPISRYSNMENGFIAQQLVGDSNYHINKGSFYVEVLSMDGNSPVKEGMIGRIVITDLHNKAMAFARYDTGDLGEFAYLNGKKVLSIIHGREVDFIYNTSGEMISPHFVTNTMWKYSEVDQFQFIQESKVDYILKLNIKDGKLTHTDKLIQQDFLEFLGEDAKLKIEYVSEVPLLSSGKRRKVVQEFYK